MLITNLIFTVALILRYLAYSRAECRYLTVPVYSTIQKCPFIFLPENTKCTYLCYPARK